MLFRVTLLKVNTRFHAGIEVQPITPSSFFTKYNLRRSLEWAFSLCPIKKTFSLLLFIVPCNQQGNQVRIYNKRFGNY